MATGGKCSIRMGTGKAVHLVYGKAVWCNLYAPNSKNWGKTDDLKEVTCQTCIITHKRRLEDALRLIETIAAHSGLDRKEIFKWYGEAKLNTGKVRSFSAGVGNICTIINGNMLSDEEFEKALDEALVKATMEE
jgi:hypothetical protein